MSLIMMVYFTLVCTKIVRIEIHWVRQYIKKHLIEVSEANMIKLRKKC